MNLESIQQEWGNQYIGIAGDDDLVIRLFKESRLKKVDSNLKRTVLHNILFMVYNVIIIVYAWLVLVVNFNTLGISVTAGAMLILSKIVFYKSMEQLYLISKINYSEPIVKLQKRIEHLKKGRIKHNRFIFIFCNLYFWFLMTLIFRMDPLRVIPVLWEKAAILVIIHIGFSILWFPLSLWILSKYDSPSRDSNFWSRLGRNSLLTDESVNFSLNKINLFLKEVESFEKGSDKG